MKKSWWIPNVDPYFERAETRKLKVTKELPNSVQFPVKHCKKCEKSYEEIRDITHNKDTLRGYYLDDFPTYGLIRKDCVKCEGDVAHEKRDFVEELT